MSGRIARLEPIHGYVAVVSVAGAVVLAVLLVTQADVVRDNVTNSAIRISLFTILVVITELRPLRVPRGEEEGEVTTSITFAFALLLSDGTAVAVLALITASVIADLIDRRTWWKAVFNVAQYTLAMAAAGTVISALTDLGTAEATRFTVAVIPAILLAGVVFVVVNTAVTGVAVAMAQGLPLLAFFREDLAFQAGSAAVLMAASPVVVVVGEHSLALLPLLAVPLAVGYRTAAVSLEKEHQAQHDALTGLANRSLFYDRVAQGLLASGGEPLTVMIIDLNRFKEINDTLGHTTGDRLLQEVGPRLQAVLDPGSTVARLGGDEFGIILRSVSDPVEIERVAQRVNDVLEQPFEVNGVRLEVGGSVGIAMARGDAHDAVDAETLVRRADVAMYVAKTSHVGYTTYDPAHDRHSLERLALVAELRQAIAQDDLVVHFQPKVDLATGHVTGAEALVRWLHPVRGMIPPDEFIPLAERTGLVRPLTMVVLDRALQQCRLWHDAGHRISVAVNLSARAVLGGGLAHDVAGALETWGVGAEWLTLELTESLIMADEVRSAEVLDELAGMGIRLSIDDFGTGYSSLAYLKRLPVDEIKIDKSFILDMLTDESDALIARSTIDLGRNLGLRVVAEGVETADVLRELTVMGCDVAQGYLLSRPVAADALLEWLDDFCGPGVGCAADAAAAVDSMHRRDLTAEHGGAAECADDVPLAPEVIDDRTAG